MSGTISNSEINCVVAYSSKWTLLNTEYSPKLSLGTSGRNVCGRRSSILPKTCCRAVSKRSASRHWKLFPEEKRVISNAPTIWLWVKKGKLKSRIEKGKIHQNLRFPGVFFLTHSHLSQHEAKHITTTKRSMPIIKKVPRGVQVWADKIAKSHRTMIVATETLLDTECLWSCGWLSLHWHSYTANAQCNSWECLQLNCQQEQRCWNPPRPYSLECERTGNHTKALLLQKLFDFFKD